MQAGLEGVVSKKTVVLRRWGSSIQKFGFINGVDNVNSIRSDDGLTLETSAFRISVRWPIYIINSFDKTKFLQAGLGRAAMSARREIVAL